MPDTAGSDSPEFSVVVPFFNEADNVDALVAEIAAAFADERWELVAVDDCSGDDTPARLRAAAAAYPQLRVVTHGVNRGQSAAICSGADAARGRWLLTLDGDGQNDPADAALLRAAVTRGSPVVMVCGRRRKRHDSFLRRLSSRVANGVRGALLGDRTPDTGCGLKLIRRDVFMRLPRFDHMHRFLPALVLREGGAIVSVAVSHRPRRFGVSKYGLWNRLGVGIVDLFGVMWLQRRAFRGATSEDSRNDG
ncbi:MAG: glycosyltransferase [Gammaproteobacteria bacterium]